jgi:hypothetical protein
MFFKLYKTNGKKQQKNPKKYIFDVFASFFLFSASFQKNSKFINLLSTRSISNALILKSLIYLSH